MHTMFVLIPLLAPLAALAGLDNPAADMDTFEGRGDMLPALILLAIVAGIVKVISTNDFGGLISGVAKSLGLLATMYLWIFVFGACIYFWLHVFRMFIDSAGLSAALAFIIGVASGWKIFTVFVDRTSKK